MKDRFQPGSGTYICRDCGKQTRETGYGESGSGLCACCFRVAEWENALSDGSISEEELGKKEKGVAEDNFETMPEGEKVSSQDIIFTIKNLTGSQKTGNLDWTFDEDSKKIKAYHSITGSEWGEINVETNEIISKKGEKKDLEKIYNEIKEKTIERKDKMNLDNLINYPIRNKESILKILERNKDKKWIQEYKNIIPSATEALEEEFDRIVEEIKKEYTGKKLKNFNRKTYNKKEDVMNAEQLRKAASDLNKTLGLEPKIDTRLAKEELTKKVSKAGTMLEDGDKIEQNTFDVLAELEVDIPAGVKKVKAQGAEKDSGKEKTEKAPAKEKKEKAEESEKMNEYGFRIGSASGDTSEYIMKGKSEKETVEMIMDSHGKDERVATGRYKIIERELKKRGFLK